VNVGTRVVELEGVTGQHLSVERTVRKEKEEFFVHLTGLDGEYFEKKDAVVLALGVLEAAGYTGNRLSLVGLAIRSLRQASSNGLADG
jgi:hypothetical protein